MVTSVIKLALSLATTEVQTTSYCISKRQNYASQLRQGSLAGLQLWRASCMAGADVRKEA